MDERWLIVGSTPLLSVWSNLLSRNGLVGSLVRTSRAYSGRGPIVDFVATPKPVPRSSTPLDDGSGGRGSCPVSGRRATPGFGRELGPLGSPSASYKGSASRASGIRGHWYALSRATTLDPAVKAALAQGGNIRVSSSHSAPLPCAQGREDTDAPQPGSQAVGQPRTGTIGVGDSPQGVVGLVEWCGGATESGESQ